jgi:hypothetical protein
MYVYICIYVIYDGSLFKRCVTKILLYIYIYIHIYIYMHVCVYVCMYVCMYGHCIRVIDLDTVCMYV